MLPIPCVNLFPVVLGDELEGIARLGGDEALEADEGGAAGTGHLEVGTVVVGAAQPHLEKHRRPCIRLLAKNVPFSLSF